jgi:hypothetical protein
LSTDHEIIDLTGEALDIARRPFGEIVAEQHPELEEQLNRDSQSFGSQLKELLPDGEIPEIQTPKYTEPWGVRR